MSEDVWILGIRMTRFGKHPHADLVDLASEAAMGALDDGGVTMAQMQILVWGSALGGGMGQMLQKQIGQTGIPGIQRYQRLRHRCHSTAYRDHVDQGRRV